MRVMAAALMAVALVLPASGASGGFQNAVAPYTYHFPRDHFAHDRYRTEWWYFTGNLRGANGRRFGFELTFFRIGLEPHASRWSAGQSKWYASQLYLAHLAITDPAAGTFVYAQTLARDALGAGFASEHSLDVRANGWSLAGTSATRPAMHVHARDGADGLDLSLHSEKPPAIHGRNGVSRKGACASCASHYYSFTRLLARGTIVRGGVRYPVNGIAWMDHEYGSDELEAAQAGWDWFSIQLNDGREVMLYRLRERDGGTTPQSSGSLIARDGSVRYLALPQFSIAADGSWRSPHTHALYPSGWNVRVDGIDAQLALVPLVRDQELADASGTSYWEGAVDVRDARTGASIGVGYVELTGYAGVVRL
jgi:predicted secreted hydrolase